MKNILISLGMAVFLFTGCARMYNTNEVSVNQLDTVYTYKTGIVTSVKRVVIKDDGSGTMTGVMGGTVIGGMFGRGNGNIFSTLLGGLTGAYIGYETGKANGEELYIKLDTGENIVTVVKGVNIKKGDKVRIILNGNKIIRVEKI
jgi:outer membrane lipoprotein SlyB